MSVLRRSLLVIPLLGVPAIAGAQSVERSIERWANAIAAAAERLAARVERKANGLAQEIEREINREINGSYDGKRDHTHERWELDEEEWQGDAQLSRIDTTFAFREDGIVELSVQSRNVSVIAWDRREARVRAETERGRFDVTLSSSRLILEQKAGGANRDRRTTTYEIMVPRGVRVMVRSSSGDVQLRGIGGEVDAHTNGGDVRIEDAASVDANSISGDIVVTRAKGRVEATTVNGDIEVADVDGDLKLESTSGDVVVGPSRGRDVELSTNSGEISYTGSIEEAGRYEFHSHSGNVYLTIPGTSNARFAIATYMGEIDSDFPVTILPGDRSLNRRPRRFEFSVGTGGPRIIAETFNGNVEIRKR